VIHRHVLAALATGIEAGNDDAAREAVMRSEWIVRRAARRRLERSLIDAALASGELVSAADPEVIRHVQRVASLELAGKDVDACDREAVARAYRGLDVRPPAAPVTTIAIGALVLLAVVAFAWAAHRLRHPRHAHPAPPPAVGAYAQGGVPRYDAALEPILADQLPSAAWKGVAEPALRHALDGREPALVAAWVHLCDAFEHPHASTLRDAAHALSSQLAGLGLGYHVEAYVKDARAVVFVYRVERVVFVRADGEPRRVLDLRRIDHLALERFVLGLESSDLSDPLVMMDRVEEFVATHVRPVAEGLPYELGDATFRRSAAGAQLATAAGSAIRAELREPLVELVAASVRRHEARHSIDLARDLDLPTPPALARYAGGEDGPFANRAKAELAAYLTQIAYDPALPQLALWNFANQAFDDSARSAEGRAAVVALEGLARRAGVGVRPPAMIAGHLDRGQLAETALPLTRLSDDALRTAARGLFQDLFEEPPVAFYDSLPAP
jgi:hypothetical protein